MLDALRVIGYGLKDLWEEFVILVVLNVLWSLAVLLPLLPFFLLRGANGYLVLLVSLVLALPLPIVSGGLCFVANQTVRGRFATWGTFARGVRRYWAKSLGVAAINVVALILLASNLQFYAVILEGAWTNIALSIWAVVGIYWLLAQLYWFPMILELESEKVLVGLRNALVMIIISPGFTFTLGLILLLFMALCIVLTVPAMLIMTSALMLIINHATRSRLAAMRKEPYRPGPEE
jgi:hypothetical protein